MASVFGLTGSPECPKCRARHPSGFDCQADLSRLFATPAQLPRLDREAVARIIRCLMADATNSVGQNLTRAEWSDMEQEAVSAILALLPPSSARAGMLEQFRDMVANLTPTPESDAAEPDDATDTLDRLIDPARMIGPPSSALGDGGETLIAKLRAANAPDRGLDCEVHEAALRQPAFFDSGLPGEWVEAPPYTASLDAALVLVGRVLPRWRPSVALERSGRWSTFLIIGDTLETCRAVREDAPTSPLSVLIALISALDGGARP